MPDKDLFSIIIINYNGFVHTRSCIDSILKNNYINFEIIVVDNASTDKTPEKLSAYFGNQISIVKLDKNYGPAKARNEGVQVSKGEYLCFLDNDTEVHKDWIIEAKRIYDTSPDIGILQSKLLLYNDRNKIDYAGEFIGHNGFLVHVAIAGTRDKGQFDDVKEILAAKSAGMFIRKKAFKASGGFDSDYFIMVEETDLGWRNWLAGYRSVFAPKSIVYHHFSSSRQILGHEKATLNIRYHGTKNYILTLIKNLEARNLLLILPRHLLIWFGFACFRIFTGHAKEFCLIMNAFWWNIRNIRPTITKRKKIQTKRCLNDTDLFRIIMKKENALTKAFQIFKARSFLDSIQKK